MNGTCTFDIARVLGYSGFCTGMTPVVGSTVDLMEPGKRSGTDTDFEGKMRSDMDPLELRL